MFSSRAGLAELATFCRRMATALEAGLDLRKVLAREAQRAQPPAWRNQMSRINQEVAAGRTFGEAISGGQEFFPPLLRDLVTVGEETGKTPEIFRHLAEHFEHLLSLRRMFLVSLTWPAIQLVASILIIGAMIWLLGVIGSQPGREPIDILGGGLVGTRGLLKYFAFWALLGGGLATVVVAVRRGLWQAQALERLVLRLPALGGSLRTLALARLAWTLNLTMQTGMPLAQALRLALRSTHHQVYTNHQPGILAAVARGDDVSSALSATGEFPRDFLDVLEVGERSGRVPEQMDLLARQYQERAQQSLTALTIVAGFAVWALVALLIIVMIFRIFSFYVGTITDALPT